MFALILAMVFGNASDDRLPEISLEFATAPKIVRVQDSVKVIAPPVKIDIQKVGPAKIASKPNPDLVIVW